MIRNKNAIVDIDSVVYDIGPEFIALLNRLTGNNFKPTDWNHWFMNEKYGIDNRTFIEKCIKYKVLETGDPIDGAVNALNHLVTNGYNLEYFTARAWYPNAEEITEDWLMNYKFPNYYNVNIIPKDNTKAQFWYERSKLTGRLYSTTLVIDDSPTEIQSYVDHGFTNIYMVDQPWNRENKELDKYRISSIKDLIKLV